MIRRIAFRNIWRNKLRSWVVISSIAVGIWGGLLVISLAKGLTSLRQSNAIETYVGHIQLHDNNFIELGGIQHTVSDAHQIENFLEKDSRVAVFVKRLKVDAYVQSARSSSGFILNGVEPSKEKQLFSLANTGPEQNFLERYKRKPPIVLSTVIAARLGMKIGHSLQCSFLSADGHTVSASFKLVDTYQSSNSLYDQINAFVLFDDLNALAGIKDVHEFVIRLKKESDTKTVSHSLITHFPNVQVDSWREIAPELGFADKMMDLVMTLFLVIIMFALAFSIVNTMLMAVLERRKELGMLLSIGMDKGKLFKMIALESVMLSLVSAPIGIILSYFSISYLQHVGIDLSFVSAGLRSVGLDSLLFPVIDSFYYVVISVLVVLTAILSSLYPASKALKLNPAETIRTAV